MAEFQATKLSAIRKRNWKQNDQSNLLFKTIMLANQPIAHKVAENLKPETATFQRETTKNAKNHKKHKQILIATHKYFKKIN